MSLDAIRRFLQHPDCIIFVGSGLSMWSGLPSWSGLLHDLADHLDSEGLSSELVRREIGNRDLLQAASYGVSKLTPASFGSFMRKATQVGTASPHAIHKALVKLGPTSFITTNYDNLVEQALILWRKDTYFSSPITNKHLVELANILSARSSHFVFKPHGDIGDISSVVLTREHYRLLLPGGERNNALEALKTLLITRPVFYVGFGLRDPDFIYLRDLLLNIYQGATRDHWAIMPDINDDEINYWRDQYGIRLHGYATHGGDDGTQDHGELLSLLEALSPLAGSETQPSTPADQSPATNAERVLALSRYASGLARKCAPKATPIEVRVSQVNRLNGRAISFGTYEGWTTTEYLTEGPAPAHLIGLPGAGKSFALRLAAHQLANRLQQACMDDALVVQMPTLPILIDLKLYHGDLRAIIDSELPAGFTLQSLRGGLPVKLFLDAFNEMSSDHLESGALFKELDALEGEIGPFGYVIASRSRDGISDRSEGAAFYDIDRFDERHVSAVLAEHQIVLTGPFAEDVLNLLSRPFFLQLVVNKIVDVPANPQPLDIYTSYLEKLQEQFSKRFETDLQLLPILAGIAFRAIEAESEAFPLAWLTDTVTSSTPPDASFKAADVINWLVGREALIPFTGHRASFVHQSITEFCAATELSRRLQLDSISHRDIIASKKWDQCLFLTLALLGPSVADKVLRDVIEADLRLAVSAVRFAEEGQSTAVTKILSTLISRTSEGRPYQQFISLRNLPVGPEHTSLLRQLADTRNILGGEAVGLLAQVEGASCKAELLDLLELHADDYNFSNNGLAPALAPMLDENDIPRLLKMGEAWAAKGRDEDGFASIAHTLSVYEPNALIRALPVPIEQLSGMVKLIANAMSQRSDETSFALLCNLLLAHPDVVVADLAIATAGRDEGPKEKYSCLDRRHIEAIWQARFSQSLWVSAMRRVCERRPDLIAHVLEMAKVCEGVEAIALHFCAGARIADLLYDVIKILERDDTSLEREPFSIFNLRELDWRGHEALLAKSVARDLPQLRKALINEPFPSLGLTRAQLGLAHLQPVIDVAIGSDNEDWWTRHKLGELVAQLGNNEVQEFCLAALARGPERMRDWVKEAYISHVDNLTIENLDSEIIAALMADLNVPGRLNEFWYNPLGEIATERFIQERLLPLATDAPPHVRDNLSVVLSVAGDRLGKRFIIPA